MVPMFRRIVTFLLMIAVLGGVLYSEQAIVIEENATKSMVIEQMKPVNANVIKPFLFGHEAFYADLFWIHCLRWSVERGIPNMFEYIYKMVDLITDLDPRFEQVYIWASLTITYASSDKLSYTDKVVASNKILHKGWDYIQNDVQGWKHFDRYWMIAQNLGFNYGIELKDRQKALEYTQVLMNIPDMPAHLKTWAAGLYRETADASKGQSFLEDLLAAETIQAQISMSDDEAVKEKLKGKLQFFYKKLNSIEYGNQRMMEIQKKVKAVVDSWRKDYSFLPFSFYVLIHSSQTVDEMDVSREMYGIFFPSLAGGI